MIQTETIDGSPTIIYHKLLGSIAEDSAFLGVEKALSLIKENIDKGEPFHLMIDMRECLFVNLSAHKIWSLKFKKNRLLQDNVLKAAVVGQATEVFQTEQKMLETERFRFFTEVAAAQKWLLND